MRSASASSPPRLREGTEGSVTHGWPPMTGPLLARNSGGADAELCEQAWSPVGLRVPGRVRRRVLLSPIDGRAFLLLDSSHASAGLRGGPDGIHILIPRTSECGLTWKKGLRRYDKDLEMKSPRGALNPRSVSS